METFYKCSIFLFANLQYLSTTVSAWDLSQPRSCLTILTGISDSKNSWLCCSIFKFACILAVYTKSRLALTEMLVAPDQLVSSMCPTWVLDCCSFLSILNRPDRRRETALFAVHEQTFPVRKLSFSQEPCKWVSVQITFKQCPRILNFVP